LTPAVSHVFEQALTTSKAANGIELAELFDKAIEEMASPQSIDYRLGRRTHVGMVRTLNEDSILTLDLNRVQQSVSQPMGVFVVADGMGGHSAGEIASGTIINIVAQKAIKELLPAQISRSDKQDYQKWLVEAVEQANSEVFSRRKSAGSDMGSTLVAAVLDGNTAYVAHIGDSRAYLVNSAGIRQLTTDHSLVERLVATGQITRDEARHHPQRNVIYRTVGDKSKVDVDVSTNVLAVGDCLLICSDGLSGMVDDNDIHKLVNEAPSPQAACDNLIQTANAAGGEDNVSVIVIKMVQL
jgi:serine/threonine protein phosphatase PrpC